MTAEETRARLEELLERLDGARERLDTADSSEAAVDVLQELVELAKDVQTELERQRRAGPELRGGDDAA